MAAINKKRSSWAGAAKTGKPKSGNRETAERKEGNPPSGKKAQKTAIKKQPAARVKAAPAQSSPQDRPVSEMIEEINSSFKKTRDVCIVFHIYYQDIAQDILTRYLASLSEKVDLIVTTSVALSGAWIDNLRRFFHNSLYIITTENRGRDIRPFLLAYRLIAAKKYKFACKIHTKTTPDAIAEDYWRNQLIGSLLKSPEEVDEIIQALMRNKDLGLIVPQNTLTALSEATLKSNRSWLNKLMARMGEPEQAGKYAFEFPASAMFWFRVRSLEKLLDEKFIDLDEFEKEAGQVDGTLPHAVERITCFLVEKSGFQVKTLPLNIRKSANRETDGSKRRGASKAATKKAILVVGMHRSGTSAVTRVLNLLGCDLPSTLMRESAQSNEVGFWESLRIMHLNDDILASAESAWNDWQAFDPAWHASPVAGEFRERARAVLESEYSGNHLFVLKDPRICRFLSFWIDVIRDFGAEPLIVLPLRNPLEVAASLEGRDAIDPSLGSLIWLRHVLDAEIDSRNVARAWLRYERLLSEPQAQIDRLSNDLNVSWPRRSSVKVEREINQFLSPELRHYHSEDKALLANLNLPHWLRTSFEIFDRWTQGTTQETDEATLDRIRLALDEATPAFSRAMIANQMTLAKRDRQVKELNQIAGERDRQIEELNRIAGERDGQIEELNHIVGERDSQIEELNHRAGERDEQIGELNRNASERDKQIEELNRIAGERDGQMEELNRIAGERNGQIEELSRIAGERDKQIEELNRIVGERDEQIEELNRIANERDGQNEELNRIVGERDSQIEELNRIASERDKQIEELNRIASKRDGQIEELNRIAGERDGQIEELNRTADERDEQIEELNRTVDERDEEIRKLNQIDKERNDLINALGQSLVEHKTQLEKANRAVLKRDGKIEQLDQAIDARLNQIGKLNRTIDEQRHQIESLNQVIFEQENQSQALNRAIDELDNQLKELRQTMDGQDNQVEELTRTIGDYDKKIEQLTQAIDERGEQIETLRNSRSWRATAPLRSLRRLGDTLRISRDLGSISLPSDSHIPAPHSQYWRFCSECATDSGKIPVLFDADFYLATNPDVRNSGADPLHHYMKFGAIEGRAPFKVDAVDIDPLVERLHRADLSKPETQDLDTAVYRAYSSDLSTYSDSELRDHYNNWGRNEDRISSMSQFIRMICNSPVEIPLDFRSEDYLTMHSDLKRTLKMGSKDKNTLIALDHFMQHGRWEKRLYSRNSFSTKPVKLKPTPINLKLPDEIDAEKRICVFAHVYYAELWDELARHIVNLPEKIYDLYVNIVESDDTRKITPAIRSKFPNARIQANKNCGRDIGGFFQLWESIQVEDYHAVCLLHTKKSPHLGDAGIAWRGDLLRAILGTKERAEENIKIMQVDKSVGQIGALNWRQMEPDIRELKYAQLLEKIGRSEQVEVEYLAGMVMFARAEVLAKVFSVVKDLELELGDDLSQKDHGAGQWAHVVECFIGHTVEAMGYRFFWR